MSLQRHPIKLEEQTLASLTETNDLGSCHQTTLCMEIYLYILELNMSVIGYLGSNNRGFTTDSHISSGVNSPNGKSKKQTIVGKI